MDALLGGEQSFVLCGVLLRRLPGCESSGDESAGTELWRRSCVPGNRWVAAATAPRCLAGLFTCAANSPRALPACPSRCRSGARPARPSLGCLSP